MTPATRTRRNPRAGYQPGQWDSHAGGRFLIHPAMGRTPLRPGAGVRYLHSLVPVLPIAGGVRVARKHKENTMAGPVPRLARALLDHADDALLDASITRRELPGMLTAPQAAVLDEMCGYIHMAMRCADTLRRNLKAA